MSINYPPNMEFNQNEFYGNQSLFNYCCSDEEQQHFYQFKILLKKEFVSEIREISDGKPLQEKLERLTFDVGWCFCYEAFLKSYPYDSRINFLDYQFKKTLHPKTFLNRVKQFLQNFDWNAYGEDFSYNYLVEKEIHKWLSKKLKKINASNQDEKVYKIDPIRTELKMSENLCLMDGQIVELRKILLDHKIIEPMELTDFYKCFDLNNRPNKFPAISYKKMFVFALTHIDGINNSSALKNFELTNYDKNKSDLKTSPIPVKWRVTQNKIASILIPPIKVNSK